MRWLCWILKTVQNLYMIYNHAKVGNDDFSLVMFGCKHADSKEFYKKSNNSTKLHPKTL